MKTMTLYRFFLKEILLGVAVAGIALKAARPALKAAIGASFIAKDVAKGHWNQAMGELMEVVDDARAAKASAMGSNPPRSSSPPSSTPAQASK